MRSRQLLKYPNVVGVGLGHKNGVGDPNDWCIRVHVSRKTKNRTKNSVPETLKPIRRSKWLPEIATDVKEVGATVLHAAPVEPGRILAMQDEGTCAALFRDGDEICALTCGHVASPNLTGLHDLPQGYLTARQQVVCRLLNKFVSNVPSGLPVIGECKRCSSLEEPIDLALVKLDLGNCSPANNPSVQGIRSLVQQQLQVGEKLTVVRSDAHKGLLTVIITLDTDHYFSKPFDYVTDNGVETVTYHGLISYPSVNGTGDRLREGDSGSAVVDANNQLVGIHIGIGNTASVAYGVSADQFMSWGHSLTLL